jgi:hypothetical protein
MLTAFMVTILLMHTSAGDGIAETHHQYHDMTDCRWGIINQMHHTQLPPKVEVLKRALPNGGVWPELSNCPVPRRWPRSTNNRLETMVRLS